MRIGPASVGPSHTVSPSAVGWDAGLGRGSLVPLPTGCFLFHPSVSFSLGFVVSVYEDLVGHLQQLNRIHSSKTFQLLEFLVDVSVRLGHKSSIDHSLVFRGLRVKWGIDPKSFTQPLTEVCGGLIWLLDHCGGLGYVGWLLCPGSQPM